MNIILKNTFDNLGGAFRFFFIPKNDVEEIGDEIEGIINSIFLKEEKSWFIFDIVQKGLQFLYEKQEGKKGQSFPVGLKGFIPKDTLEVRNILRSMDNHRFIIIYQDRNNNYVLAGSKEVPLRFRSAFTTDKQEGLNGHEIEFSAKTIDRPFYVDPQVLSNNEVEDPEEPLPEPDPDVIWSCDYSISEIVVKGDIVELQVTVNRLDEGTTISTNPVVVTWTIIDAGFPYEIDMIFGESGTESFSETQQANLAGDGTMILTFQLNSDLLPMGNNTVNIASHCGSQDIPFEVIPQAQIEFAMDLSLRYDVMDLLAETCSIIGDVAYITDGSDQDNSTFNQVFGTFNNLMDVLGDIDYKIQLNNDAPINKNIIVVGGGSAPFNQTFTEKFIRGVNTIKLIIDNEIIQSTQFTVNFPSTEPVFVFQDDYSSSRACYNLGVSFSVLNDSDYQGQALIQIYENGQVLYSQSYNIQAHQTANVQALFNALDPGAHQFNILLNGISIHNVTEEIPELFPVASPEACYTAELSATTWRINWKVNNNGCVDGDITYFAQLDSGPLKEITAFVPASGSLIFRKTFTDIASGPHAFKVYHADRTIHCTKEFTAESQPIVVVSDLYTDPQQPRPRHANRVHFLLENIGDIDANIQGQVKVTHTDTITGEQKEYYHNWASLVPIASPVDFYMFIHNGIKMIPPYDDLGDYSLPYCFYGDYHVEVMHPYDGPIFDFQVPLSDWWNLYYENYGTGVKYQIRMSAEIAGFTNIKYRGRLVLEIISHSTVYGDWKYPVNSNNGCVSWFCGLYKSGYVIPDGEYQFYVKWEWEGQGIQHTWGPFTWLIENGASPIENVMLTNDNNIGFS